LRRLQIILANFIGFQIILSFLTTVVVLHFVQHFLDVSLLLFLRRSWLSHSDNWLRDNFLGLLEVV